MKKRPPTRRKLRRNINLLIIHAFFSQFRFYSSVGVLIFATLTGSYTVAMSIFAFESLMQACFEIPTGVLSDRWGRRGTLIAGTISQFIAISCYTLAFSSQVPLLLLYTGSIFYGFSNALFSGNNQAMAYETLAGYKRTKEIARIMGRISSMGQAGLGLAATFAILFLWAGLSYETLLSLSLISLSINILLSFFTIEPPDRLIEEDTTWSHMKKAAHAIMRNKKLRLVAIASAIQCGGGQASYYFTPGFINTVWATWMTPLYRVGQHIVGALSFWFAAPLIKKFSAIRVLQVGYLFSFSLTSLALALSNFFSPFVLVLTQVAYGAGTTADSTLQQENFTDAQRATMGSLIAFFSAIITAVASLLTGWISDLSTPAFAMGFMILSRAIVVQGLYAKVYKHHK